MDMPPIHALAAKLAVGKPTTAAFASLLAFAGTELLTHDASWALVAALVAAPVAVALCRSIPAIILALKESRVANGAMADTNFAHLFEHQQRFHASEVASVRLRVTELTRREILMRITKHNLLNAVNEMMLLARDYEWRLKEAEIVVVPHEFPNFKKLLLEEDAGMLEISAELFNHVKKNPATLPEAN